MFRTCRDSSWRSLEQVERGVMDGSTYLRTRALNPAVLGMNEAGGTSPVEVPPALRYALKDQSAGFSARNSSRPMR